MVITIEKIEKMVQKGVHLGHHTSRWNPKMAPYIYTKKNGVHVIDLMKTFSQLQHVSKQLFKYASQRKTFLFVGTKPQASQTIARVANKCQSFYVNQRWLGGMLTNWRTIKRSLRILKELETLESSQVSEKLPRKELATLRKRKDRLQKYLGGIKGMFSLPDVVIIVGQIEEMNAVLECRKLGITTVSILDTDCDPTLTDLLVVANDDSTKSIELICNVFLKAIKNGKASIKESITSVPLKKSAIPIKRSFRSTSIKSRINA